MDFLVWQIDPTHHVTNVFSYDAIIIKFDWLIDWSIDWLSSTDWLNDFVTSRACVRTSLCFINCDKSL